MHGARRLLQRIGRWFARWGAALVIEAECPDGTRLLIGPDVTWCGTPTIAVLGTRTGGDLDGGSWIVPDDVRDLVR